MSGLGELLGITASIIQLFDLVVKISSTVHSLKDAPENFRSLVTQIKALKAALEMWNDCMLEDEDFESNWKASIQVLQTENAISKCLTILLKLETKFSIIFTCDCLKSKAHRLREAIVYQFKEDKINSYIAQLKDYVEIFQIAFQCDNLYAITCHNDIQCFDAKDLC